MSELSSDIPYYFCVPEFSTFSSTNTSSITSPHPPPSPSSPTRTAPYPAKHPHQNNHKKKKHRRRHDDVDDDDYESGHHHHPGPLVRQPGVQHLDQVSSVSSVSTATYNTDEASEIIPKKKQSKVTET